MERIVITYNDVLKELERIAKEMVGDGEMYFRPQMYRMTDPTCSDYAVGEILTQLIKAVPANFRLVHAHRELVFIFEKGEPQ